MASHVMIVLRQILTLFLIIGAGFFIGKKRWIGADGMKTMTFLILNIALPCSVIRSFSINTEGTTLSLIGRSFFAVAIVIVALAAGSMLLFRKESDDRRPVMQLGSVYNNSAFMGLALVQSILGEGAGIFASIIFIVGLICLLIQIEIVMPKGRPSLGKVLTNPGVIGFLIGLVLLVSGLTLPSPLNAAVGSLAGMNAPLAMLLLGLQIAQADLKTVFTQKELYGAALIKLLVVPVLTYLILLPFGLPSVAVCTFVICNATCQPAVLSAFVAQRDRDAVAASQLIALTSILQLVTLPAAAAIASML